MNSTGSTPKIVIGMSPGPRPKIFNMISKATATSAYIYW